MRHTQARFFDGKGLKAFEASVVLYDKELLIQAKHGEEKQSWRWSLSDLQVVTHMEDNGQLTLSHHTMDDARLVITDQHFYGMLVKLAPKRKIKAISSSWSGLLIYSAIAIAICAVLFFSIPFLSRQLAQLIPQSSFAPMGDLAILLMTDEESCHSPNGDAALQKLVNRLSHAMDIEDPIHASVYYAPETLNAFATAGRQLVLLSALFDEIDDDNAIIGVLAHEIGHIEKRHLEAGLIRAMGGEFVVSLMLGYHSGVSESAIFLSDMKYSRDDESEADLFAARMLHESGIDPNGIAQFFRFLTENYEMWSDNEIISVVSTHPDTKSRIKAVDAYIATLQQNDPRTYSTILTEAEWKALRHICMEKEIDQMEEQL